MAEKGKLKALTPDGTEYPVGYEINIRSTIINRPGLPLAAGPAHGIVKIKPIGNQAIPAGEFHLYDDHGTLIHRVQNIPFSGFHLLSLSPM